MTWLEKILIENPQASPDEIVAHHCPSDRFGGAPNIDSVECSSYFRNGQGCRDCWNSEFWKEGDQA